FRKADDAGGVAQMFDTPEDVRPLRVQRVGGIRRVELGVGVRTELAHERCELGVARLAWLTISQMLGRRRIHALAGLFGEVTLVEPIVLKMSGAPHHGLPPRMLRSLRAARNR